MNALQKDAAADGQSESGKFRYFIWVEERSTSKGVVVGNKCRRSTSTNDLAGEQYGCKIYAVQQYGRVITQDRRSVKRKLQVGVEGTIRPQVNAKLEVDER